MFTATFTKSICNSPNSNDVSVVALFKRKEVLPFEPAPEIYVSWPNDVEYFVGKVTWDFGHEAFVCQVFEGNDASANFDFDSQVKRSINAGWTLISQEQVERKKSFWEKNK